MNVPKKDGEKLQHFLESKHISTLQCNKKLNELTSISSIVIFGSSWVGKTTIRNILYTLSQNNPVFSFPKRIVTREQRPNDNLEENDFVETLDELKDKVQNGLIWERDLGESQEYYGFTAPPLSTIPIYSANNALFRQKDVLIQGVLANPLFVLVYAPNEERLSRNEKREGVYLNTKPLQKKVRLLDSSDSLFEEAHIIVHNGNQTDIEKQQVDLLNLLDGIQFLSN